MDDKRLKEIDATIREKFLCNTGAKDLEEVNGWFKKSYTDDWKIDRMDEVASAIKKWPRTKPVGIIADFDTDGITSASILCFILRELGFEDVKAVIPKRMSEGYGGKPEHIKNFEYGSLLIFVDNGISAFEAIEEAKRQGMTVIVLDHHQQAEELPPADIIIDPATLGGADFCDYCGAGLSYRLGTKLLGGYKNAIQNTILPLAAIGTVADVMPLTKENYVIVRNGLTLLNKGLVPPGVKMLIDALKLSVITEKDIGFSIAPCINASGRIIDDGAMDVFRLLSAKNITDKEKQLAFELVMRNEQRKTLKKEAIAKIEERIKGLDLTKNIPLVIYEPGITEGILGILAGHFADPYNLNMPVYILSDAMQEGEIKGSGRSSGNYNMAEELRKVSDTLLAFGGHPGAAGLSLEKKNLEEFKKGLLQNMKDLDFVPDEIKTAEPDLYIKEDEVHETNNILRKYAPWGEGNPEPIIGIKDFPVVEKYEHRRQLSKDGNTVRFIGPSSTAIGFGWGPKTEGEPETINVVGTLSTNYYMGKASDQIEILSVSY